MQIPRSTVKAFEQAYHVCVFSPFTLANNYVIFSMSVTQKVLVKVLMEGKYFNLVGNSKRF